jgi:hypothetical protein
VWIGLIWLMTVASSWFLWRKKWILEFLTSSATKSFSRTMLRGITSGGCLVLMLSHSVVQNWKTDDKVELPHCLSILTLQRIEGAKVKLHAFLNSLFESFRWSASRYGGFTHSIQYTWDMVGPRPGVYIRAKRQFSRNGNQVVKPVTSHYIDWAIQAHNIGTVPYKKSSFLLGSTRV